MMIYSGVRISELLNLKKEHINLEEKFLSMTRFFHSLKNGIT